MKVVIDVHDEVYNKIREGGFWLESGLTLSDAYDAIKNGTPLPKGHGDLIDRNVALADFDKADLSKKEMIGKLVVFGTPTVIPADK